MPRVFAPLLACAALALAACSKDTPPAPPAAVETQQAPATSAADARPHGRRGGGDGPDEGKHGRVGPGRMFDPERFLATSDRDKNGSVELTELPEPPRARFAPIDTDKNGALSLAELQAHARAMTEKRFARMDRNKDGNVTADEMPERMWERFKVADADSNNAVSLAEMIEAQKNGKLRGGGRGGPGGPRGEHAADLDEMIRDATDE